MEENQTPPQTNSNQAEGNVKAALTYLAGWLTGLIFLLTEKEDKFVRFHAAQSLVFFGLITIITIITMVPFLGQLLGLIIWPLSLVLWIVLMLKAYKNEKFELPVISDWAKQLEPKI
jgi:uncharacterized membrane protein